MYNTTNFQTIEQGNKAEAQGIKTETQGNKAEAQGNKAEAQGITMENPSSTTIICKNNKLYSFGEISELVLSLDPLFGDFDMCHIKFESGVIATNVQVTGIIGIDNISSNSFVEISILSNVAIVKCISK